MQVEKVETNDAPKKLRKKTYRIDQGCQSQMNGGLNKTFTYKMMAILIKSSLKNCKMTAYSQVNQTIAPVPDYCLVHRTVELWEM